MDGDDRGARRTWRSPAGVVAHREGILAAKVREIGLSIDDDKRIMTMLQELVAKQDLATFALAPRVWAECKRYQLVKGYTMRKIRSAFGTVEVKSPRWRHCRRRLFPHMHGVHGPQRDLSGSGHARINGAHHALGEHHASSQAGAGLLAEFPPIEPPEARWPRGSS